MGQNASSEQKHGYHVLKVVPGSPAARAGLIPFFDYIVAVNKTLLDEEANSLIKVISDNVNSRLSFYVYSSKTNAYRNVKFEFPIEKWTTTGENGWLGFSVRYCSYEGAADHFWHVLAVVKDFPAFLAGIQPKTDYIIGSPNHILRNQTDLYDLFDKYINKPLHLYVYSTVTNKCREIIVVPTSKNGEGCIGCTFSYGDRISVKDILKNKDQQKSQIEETQSTVPLPEINTNQLVNEENISVKSPKNEDNKFDVTNMTKPTIEINSEESINQEDKKPINDTIKNNKEDSKLSVADIHITNKKRDSLNNIYNENTMPTPYVQSLDNSIQTLFPKKKVENNNKTLEVVNENLNNYEITLDDISHVSNDDNLSALDKLSEFEAATKENNFSLRPSSSRLNLPSQKNEEKKQSPLQTSLTLDQDSKEVKVEKQSESKEDEEIPNYIKTPEQFLNELFLKEFNSTPEQNKIDMGIFSGNNDTGNELDMFNKLSEQALNNIHKNENTFDINELSYDFSSSARNNEFDDLLKSDSNPNSTLDLNINENLQIEKIPSPVHENQDIELNNNINQLPSQTESNQNQNINIISVDNETSNGLNSPNKSLLDTKLNESEPNKNETNNESNISQVNGKKNILNSLPVSTDKNNTPNPFPVNTENNDALNPFPINTENNSALNPFPVNTENIDSQNPFPVNTENNDALNPFPVNTENINSQNPYPVNTENKDGLNSFPINTENSNALNPFPVNSGNINAENETPIISSNILESPKIAENEPHEIMNNIPMPMPVDNNLALNNMNIVSLPYEKPELIGVSMPMPINNDVSFSAQKGEINTENQSPQPESLKEKELNQEIIPNDLKNTYNIVANNININNDKQKEEKKEKSDPKNNDKESNRISFIHNDLFKSNNNDEINFFDQMNSGENTQTGWNFADSINNNKNEWDFNSQMPSSDVINENTAPNPPTAKEQSGWNFNLPNQSPSINNNNQTSASLTKESGGWNFNQPSQSPSMNNQNITTSSLTKEPSGWNFNQPSQSPSMNNQNVNTSSLTKEPSGWNFNQPSQSPSINQGNVPSNNSGGWNFNNTNQNGWNVNSPNITSQEQNISSSKNENDWNFDNTITPNKSSSPIQPSPKSSPPKQSPPKQISPKLESSKILSPKQTQSNNWDWNNDNNSLNKENEKKSKEQNNWDFNDSIPFDNTTGQNGWDFTSELSNTKDNKDQDDFFATLNSTQTNTPIFNTSNNQGNFSPSVHSAKTSTPIFNTSSNQGNFSPSVHSAKTSTPIFNTSSNQGNFSPSVHSAHTSTPLFNTSNNQGNFSPSVHSAKTTTPIFNSSSNQGNFSPSVQSAKTNTPIFNTSNNQGGWDITSNNSQGWNNNNTQNNSNNQGGWDFSTNSNGNQGGWDFMNEINKNNNNNQNGWNFNNRNF